MTVSYTFTIEDLTAPTVSALLWLTPRKVRVKFNEAMSSSSAAGGALFVVPCLGGVEVLNTSQVKLAGLVPDSSWIGQWLHIAGSAYPANNRHRPITSVDSTSHTATVDISSTYGGPLVADNGVDKDTQNNIARQRLLKASVTSYFFTARLSSEGASYDPLAAERTQCAFCPMPIAVSAVPAADLPSTEDPLKYIYLDVHDDISFGRLYTFHADTVEDLFGNAANDAQLNFTSPSFGIPTNRIKLWQVGLLAGSDMSEDLGRERLLRKLSVVLQDVINSVWHRVDQFEYLLDPSRCPSELVDYLLYEYACPFRFPMTESMKRLVLTHLPTLYKHLGTEDGIENFLFSILGLNFEIRPYVEDSFWQIGISQLGTNAMLGPGSAYSRNSYEIVSLDDDLTDEQYRIVVEVATWADPINMHLIRIIQPSGVVPVVGPAYWQLGSLTTGELSITTLLGG